MEWEHWKHKYFQIVSDFGYDPQKDLEAALVLNDLLKNKMKNEDFIALKRLIQDEIIFIYGCGPSLPHHLTKLVNSSLHLKNFTHIVADGATTALLEFNIKPNIIITDLDGRIPDLITANKQGAIVLIHAHGNNLKAINQNFTLFPRKILGSTQNQPLSRVKNYGGFTDGDRCIFLASKMECSKVFLFGFDFGTIIGKYSKPYMIKDEVANEIKIKKLQWAQNLISELAIHKNLRIYKINRKNVVLENIKNIEFEEIFEFL